MKLLYSNWLWILSVIYALPTDHPGVTSAMFMSHKDNCFASIDTLRRAIRSMEEIGLIACDPNTPSRGERKEWKLTYQSMEKMLKLHDDEQAMVKWIAGIRREHAA